MRILMVGSDPAQGLLYHPTGLAVAFKKLGHEPHVVTWGDGEQTAGLNRLLADHSVPVHKVQCLSKKPLEGAGRVHRCMPVIGAGDWPCRGSDPWPYFDVPVARHQE